MFLQLPLNTPPHRGTPPSPRQACAVGSCRRCTLRIGVRPKRASLVCPAGLVVYKTLCNSRDFPKSKTSGERSGDKSEVAKQNSIRGLSKPAGFPEAIVQGERMRRQPAKMPRFWGFCSSFLCSSPYSCMHWSGDTGSRLAFTETTVERQPSGTVVHLQMA